MKRTLVNGLNRERGLAILEAGFMFVLFLTFLSFAFPVVDYVQVTEALKETVDRNIYDQVIRPYSLQFDGRVALEESRLSDGLLNVMNKARSELADSLGENVDSRAAIEGICVSVEVNRETGIIRSVREVPSCSSRRLGMERVKAGSADLIALARKVFAVGSPAQEFLAPSGVYDYDVMSKTGRAYWVEQVAAVGLKITYSFDRGWTGRALELLGLTDASLVSSLKIVPLRGEVD